jgi:hypothetical protein
MVTPAWAWQDGRLMLAESKLDPAAQSRFMAASELTR